ncbi:MAG: type II secretion system protein GspG, partial [Acidobacteriota bacterium]
MPVRICLWALVAGWVCLSCGSDDSRSSPSAGRAAAKISDVAIQAYFSRIQTAAQKYRAVNGAYPDDVRQLVEHGFLVEGSDVDPWGHPWVLRTEAGRLTVISYGADGKPGGSEDDRDRSS